MHELKLLEGGWLLIGNKPDYCSKCKGEIKMPFYFCKGKEIGFCYECERNPPFYRHCLETSKEHEHFHIIGVNKDEN